MTGGRAIQVLVQGDRLRLWSFGRWFVAYAAPSGWILLGLATFASEVEPRTALLAGLLMPVLAGVYGFGFCVVWRYTLATVAYAVDGEDLVACRRVRVVVRVPITEVADIRVDGYMDRRHMLTDPTPPPEWPAAVITLRDGTTVTFPEIMVWGRSEARDIAARLRTGLSR